MNNNPIQSNTTTPIHTHNLQPLELQAVGGAMRLGRKVIGESDGEQKTKQVMAV